MPTGNQAHQRVLQLSDKLNLEPPNAHLKALGHVVVQRDLGDRDRAAAGPVNALEALVHGVPTVAVRKRMRGAPGQNATMSAFEFTSSNSRGLAGTAPFRRLHCTCSRYKQTQQL